MQQALEELPSRPPVRLVDKPGDRELDGAVDRNEQVELAFTRLHLGNVPLRGSQANHCRARDVKEAHGIALEALPLRLVAINIW
ncbi:hypothetical protein GGR05_000205 [Aureimonas phyllosphaerae]|uniref:Uncharacterized protein n=1 Tax=Aureimonas phyllosphaerae TaxID=1166078 RepID=A0A7W6FSF7_9HYPH|nr:hypothetical protein [Aureimonas phyllosphaerae]MBB3958690.1 hypothetical protein [Aureimonas phyllosphaerae]